MPQAPLPKFHILIVEDDPSICDLVRRIIEREERWQPTCASCGAQAVEAWNNGNFDLIIMDLKMSYMDGMKATKQIREMEEKSGRSRTPIIAFTAMASEEDRKKCMDIGFDDFIAKPGSMKVLIDTVRKYTLKLSLQSSLPPEENTRSSEFSSSA